KISCSGQEDWLCADGPRRCGRQEDHARQEDDWSCRKGPITSASVCGETRLAASLSFLPPFLPRVFAAAHCVPHSRPIESLVCLCASASASHLLMKIHEYQGKSILARYGVAVPRGEMAE